MAEDTRSHTDVLKHCATRPIYSINDHISHTQFMALMLIFLLPCFLQTMKNDAALMLAATCFWEPRAVIMTCKYGTLICFKAMDVQWGECLENARGSMITKFR